MEIKYEGDTMRFDHGGGLGRAWATPLPGTYEVQHIHGSYIRHEHRGAGLGGLFHKERLRYFKEEFPSAKVLTCIVNAENEPEIKILKKNGWEFLRTFNSFEGRDLILCFKEL
jgi:RimJ/RimL family protein N-acetyltransferase